MCVLVISQVSKETKSDFLFFLLAKKASKAILVNVTKTNALKNRLNDRSCEVKFSSRKVFFVETKTFFLAKKVFSIFTYFVYIFLCFRQIYIEEKQN